MKTYQFIFLLLIISGCKKLEKKPCDNSNVDWTYGPSRSFGYLDSVDKLLFLHNSNDTIELIKLMLQENFRNETHCGSGCINGGACPDVYRLNSLTTTFRNQENYHLSVLNDYSLSSADNIENPKESRIFQFNQVKATFENTVSWKPKPPYTVDSNITFANKFYPIVYTFSDKENLLLVSNDLNVLKFIDSVKQDTLIALYP
jgi:hypothetical protein